MGKVLVSTAALITVLVAVQVSAEPRFEMTTGGMQYKTLVEGKGPPVEVDQTAHIHVVGWLAKAGQKGRELFNSRRDKGVISYVLGTDRMLPAFNEGVIGMKPGERRLLMVPPVFAYGERGVEDAVPPNASLILLVDLVRVGPD
jgi:FKBP-type peptidyl-prolyl cis-trans isomerase